MKKGIQILLVMVMVISILGMSVVGCAKEEAPATPAAPVAPEVVEWKLQSTGPLGTATVMGPEWWSGFVEQGSNGRLKVTVYPVGQLVKSLDILDAMRDGVLDMGTMYGGYYKEFMPEAGMACGFPMILRNSSDMREAYWMLGFGELLAEAYAEHGVYYLNCASYGMVPIWATKPLRTLADFQGVKIRAVGEASDMLGDMGAAVTYIAHEESFTALQLGTIEGYSTGVGLYRSLKHYEVCPYLMMPPVLALGLDTYGISIKTLDALPEDLVAFIKSQGPALDMAQTWMAERDDHAVTGSAEKLGFELVQYEDDVVEAMTEAGLGFLDSYAAKSDRCAKMSDILKGLMKDRGYID